MLSEKKLKVKQICDEVYVDYQQIVIDLVQDEVEELLHPGHIRRDAVGAAAYHCMVLLEIFNPKYEKDIDLLKRLNEALNELEKAVEKDNVESGKPIEA